MEPGYSYHSETNLDLVQPVLSELAAAYEALGLPLRSLENEWGPGQVECTFAHQEALRAADNFVLFRTATKQIVRRLGYHASFMCRPALRGLYSSGWHLHQSLASAKDGRNVFVPERADDWLSPLGMAFLGGLVEHAIAATVFSTPTVNGYRQLPARLARARSRRLGPRSSRRDAARARRPRRPGHPAREPHRRAVGQSVSLFHVADRRRDGRHRRERSIPARRTTIPMPPSARCSPPRSTRRSMRWHRARSSARPSATPSSTIT